MGVGHFLSMVSRLGAPFVAYSPRPSPGSPLFPDPLAEAGGVGQQEVARPSVRGADVLGRNAKGSVSRTGDETQSSKVFAGDAKSLG